MKWLSLLLPSAYLFVLVGSLATFSYIYRQRKAAAAEALEPWFPPHLQRNIYLSLLEIQAKPDTKVPDSVLKAALLRRATEDIHRILSIRNAKPALQQLIARGSVGDELMQRFLLAEKEIEQELRDVVEEANALAPQQNWGATIFQSAGECVGNEILRKQITKVEAKRQSLKQNWEVRRKSIKSGFMKELQNGGEVQTDRNNSGSSDEPVIVQAGGDAPPSELTTPSGRRKSKGKK